MIPPTGTSTNRATSRLWLVIPALLFLLSLAMNLNDVPTTEFHPDETRWINRAHYFPDLLDPFGPTWEDQYLTRGQPPLGSYLMGLGLLLQGRDTETNGVWDFAYGSEWNRLSGAMTEEADLTAARRTNAVVAAITVVVVFFVGRALTGTIAGTAGGLLLAVHPLHIWIGSQALSDQLLILIIALTVLTAIHLGRGPGRGKALLLGILLGLGGAVKLSPLLLSIPVALYGAALLLLARGGLVDRAKARRLAPLLLVQPIIAAITFVASYPYLWPAPIERTINLFELRTQEMEGQASAWPQVAIAHPGEGLLRVYDRLTWQSSATGNLAEDILRRFGIESDVWGIDLLLAVLGIAALAWLVIRRGLTSGTALAAYVLAGQIAGIIVGMRVDFYRYHLPIVLAVAILAGVAVQRVWALLVSRATHDQRSVSGSTGQPMIHTGSR